MAHLEQRGRSHAAPRFALASCEANGDKIEIEEPFTDSEMEAEAALRAGGYVEVAPNLWEGAPGAFACVVDMW